MSNRLEYQPLRKLKEDNTCLDYASINKVYDTLEIRDDDNNAIEAFFKSKFKSIKNFIEDNTPLRNLVIVNIVIYITILLCIAKFH